MILCHFASEIFRDRILINDFDDRCLVQFVSSTGTGLELLESLIVILTGIMLSFGRLDYIGRHLKSHPKGPCYRALIKHLSATAAELFAPKHLPPCRFEFIAIRLQPGCTHGTG